MVIVVEHHERPGAGDEVPARERSEAPLSARVHRLARSVDAAEPRVDAGLAAALLPDLHRAESHQVVPRPHELRVRVALEQPLGSALGSLLAIPGRVDLLLDTDRRLVLGDGAPHALVAVDRRGRRAVAGDRDQVELGVGAVGFFLGAARDERFRRQVSRVLGARLERAKSPLVTGAGGARCRRAAPAGSSCTRERS